MSERWRTVGRCFRARRPIGALRSGIGAATILRGRGGFMAGSLRRLTTLVAAALIVSLAFGTGLSSAAPAGKKLTREQVAAKLLSRQGGRLFTNSARLALEAIQHGGGLQPAERGRESAPGKLKQAAGGVAAAASGALTNIRVNDPSADSNQPDQTTQSETAVAVSG